MQVFRRIKLHGPQIPINQVLGADELWTSDFTQGRDFSEKEASDIVKDLQKIDDPKYIYWCSDKWIGPSCWHCQGRHLGKFCNQ